MKKYHYVYVTYTDNLCWGRKKIHESRTKPNDMHPYIEGYGGCVVEKERRYED